MPHIDRTLSKEIIFGTVDSVRRKIEQTDEINVIDEYGYTPLIETTIVNDLEKAKLLIKAGADVNSQDLTGRTALHWATDNSNIEMSKLLLSNNANPNAISAAGMPVLVMPMLRKDRISKELLYRYNGDLNFSLDFINAKLLGHRYDLVGHVDILNNVEKKLVEIDFEGFFLEFTVSLVEDSLRRYANNYSARKFRHLYEKINLAIQRINIASELMKYKHYTIDKTKFKDQITNLLDSKFLLLPVAFDAHAITYIRYGDILVRCDRGEYGRKHGTVIIYKMHAEKLFDFKLITHLLYERKTKEFINTELPRYLALQKIGILPLSPQVTGNCSWANVEASILAMLFILLLQDHEKQNQEILKRCEDEAVHFFREWTKWDQTQALDQCVDDFYRSDKARQATKAAVMAAILFQQCNHNDPNYTKIAKKIIPVLSLPEYQYILKIYINLFYKKTPWKIGENLVEILDDFGVDTGD